MLLPQKSVRRTGRWPLILAIGAFSQLAAICTPPDTPDVAYLDHAEDLVEVSEWLRWQAPIHSLSSVRAPVIPFAALPLTTTESELILESVVTMLQRVECRSDVCTGSLSSSGPHSSGYEQFAISGTWTTEGILLQAQGSSRQSDGLVHTRWSYDGSSLRTLWSLPYARAVTAILTEASTELTYASRHSPVQTCRMLGRDAQTVAVCTPTGISYVPEAAQPITWPTAVAENLFADGSWIATYPDGSTAWAAPVLPASAVYAGATVFGARSRTSQRSATHMQADWTYSRCEVYHTLTDVQYGLPATGSDAIWSVARTIVTYNGNRHTLASQVRPGSPPNQLDDRRAYVHADLPGDSREGTRLPFATSGAFAYSRDISGWFGMWRGSLQTEYGDVLLVEMRRDPAGRWSVSGSFDNAGTDENPDEEVSIHLHLDGSGSGIAFKLRSLDDDDSDVDIGATAIERIEIPFVFPQPGARLTERPADCY